ncbi:SH2 domain-containing adapter protein B [Elysia marginata]|uniref:SH2 domain-containing adapter protein B n=1 Tax=Elysia marginata TaxID=1093978 RepID=A0AAV4I150_9GAST|nr:SH2 domain-containing adapter protein B [Elysia marginata]
MSSETKKEFLQKYMLDSYSRAIPTHALQGKTAALGEYCDPVDSYKNQNRRHTEDSEDSDPGYALPQDALGGRVNQKSLHSKTRRSLDEDDSGDVYELAQNPVEVSDSSQSRLPSSRPAPKPRPSARRSQTVDVTSNANAHLSKTSSLDDAEYKTNVEAAPGEEALSMRRPSKRCVEIEYEIASEIRMSKQGPGPPAPQTSSAMPNHNSHKIDNSGTPGVRKSGNVQHAGNAQIIPVSAPFKGAQGGSKRDFVYNMSQPASESMYEEPWDLKARRLKQEEDRASRISMSKGDFSAGTHAVPPSEPSVVKQESVYEDAWDTAAQQRKLEARLNFARSLSTTSETTEIFHDALDNLPQSKSDGPTTTKPEPKLKPLPTDTYEDAWDLKNTILDQKLRSMQVQASASYEEPWDLKKQHQQIQSRLSSVNPSASSTEPVSVTGATSKGVKHRATSEAYDQSWPGSDSHSSHSSASPSSLRSSKHHSVDDPSKTKAKSRGSNIGQRINPMIPLPNQNWYHGNITRDDAEKMLRVCKEGSYIVRISSDRKSYSLSIKSAKQNIHVQIEQVGLLDGSVRYILGKNSREFCSIPEMIDYYTHHRVPLKGAEHITLLHPVECKWSSNNSQ